MRWREITTYGLSGFLLTVVLALNFIYLWPVDVLKYWKMRVDPKVYHTGEAIVIKSTYQKVRSVSGESARYLACGNQRYRINAVEGGGKPPGTRSASIKLIIPTDVPTPAKCRIYVEVNYPIFGIRNHQERNISNEFRLE